MASAPPLDATSAVTRALVLSNAAPGAVGQSVGLATALGFAPPRADSALVDAEDGGPRDAPGDVHCAIRLVGEAAFVASALPPAPSSLGVSLVALAQRLVRSLPASWHVRLHALVEALCPRAEVVDGLLLHLGPGLQFGGAEPDAHGHLVDDFPGLVKLLLQRCVAFLPGLRDLSIEDNRPPDRALPI